MKVALFVWLFALSASAAPVITSISPTSGPVTGGTAVTIKGSGFAIGATVAFGNLRAASVTAVDSATIVAVTPPHLPTTVGVVVSQSDGGAVLRDAFTFTGDPANAFDRVLLPIFLPPISGAFGSTFVTEFNLGNRGSDDLAVYGLAYDCIILCPPFYDVDIPFVLPSQSHASNALAIGNPGRMLWIPKPLALQFVGNLRVRDTARAEQSGGSEIPLPRDAAFRSDSIVLLGVPFDVRFRVKVRVYSADRAATAVTIDANGTRASVPLRGGADIFTPAYGEFSDFVLPPPPPGTTAVITTTMTVRPLTPGTRIWAFATATSNASQEITVISPQ